MYRWKIKRLLDDFAYKRTWHWRKLRVKHEITGLYKSWPIMVDVTKSIFVPSIIVMRSFYTIVKGLQMLVEADKELQAGGKIVVDVLKKSTAFAKRRRANWYVC